MIIGAHRKYQVKVCVCRAFGEVANRILHAGAQRRTGEKGQKQEQQQKVNQKKQ